MDVNSWLTASNQIVKSLSSHDKMSYFFNGSTYVSGILQDDRYY